MEREKNKSNSFLIQGSILAFASIISRLIGMVYRVPLNNMIGNEGAGIYSYAFKIYNICLILSCYSIPTAVSRLVASKVANKEHRNAYRIFIAALMFSVTVGASLSCILYFGADFFATSLLKSPQSAMSIRMLAPNILIFSIMGVLRGYFQGKNTMMPTSISQIIEQVVNAIVSLVAAYYFMMAHSASMNISAYGAMGGTLGTVMGSLAGLFFLIFVFVIYKPIVKRQIRRDRLGVVDTYPQIFRMIVLTILPIVLSQAVYQFSGFLDTIVFNVILEGKGLTHEVRDSLIGIYAGKYELLTNVPIAIATAIGAAIVPSIVASLMQKDFREIRRKMRATIKFNMIVAIPSAVGLAVLAKPIIIMLFNDTSTQDINLAANLFRFGSIAVVFVALSTTTNAILNSLNYLKIPVYHSLIALVVHVVVVASLLQFTDAKLYALVIGYILFAAIVSILNLIYMRKMLKYHQEYTNTFVLPFVCSLLMGIITLVSYKLVLAIIHSNTIAVLISLVFAMVSYLALLVAMHVVGEQELYSIPKGRKLVRLLKKLHLL